MKILVFEAVSSGLIKEFKSDILCEALAMLIYIIKDLMELGHNISTVLNNKLLTFFHFNWWKNIDIIKTEKILINELKRLADKFDAIYIIAPETDDMLYNLVSYFEGKHMNSSPLAIKQISDKGKLAEEMLKKGVKVPKTIILSKPSVKSILNYIRDLNYPVVIKPRSGVGCEGLTILNKREDVERKCKFLIKRYETIIIQKFISGIPASISLVTDGSKYIILSVNRQFIRFSKAGYYGGYTPIKHIDMQQINLIASRIIKTYKGLKGYIGIDIVISKNGIYLVEVNPRLTVSYIGISRILNINPARLLIDSYFNNIYNYNILHKNVCYFRKMIFIGDILSILNNTYLHYNNIDLIPPIPVETPNKAYGFILVNSTTLADSINKFRERVNELSLNLKISISKDC